MLSSTVMKQILKRFNKVYQTKMYFTVKCEVLIKPGFGKREFYLHHKCWNVSASSDPFLSKP